jgi:UPF0755 protein
MKRRRRLRKWARVALVVAGLLGVSAYWAIWAPAGKGEARVISIAPGESARQVGAQLQKEGLIRSEGAFLAYAWVTRRYGRLQAGGYRLEPRMSAAEILEALSRGTHRAWRWLTIPEGYTVRQIAEAVAAEKLASEEDFLRAARRAPEVWSSLPSTGVEGYLFPDTYRVEFEATAEDLVGQMLGQFEETVGKGLFQERTSVRGRSLHEVITLASLVEAEAKQDRERPVIAGVLANRLRQGRKLECDATVQYALGVNRKQRLLYKDLKVESEYNTYLHAGLPPGPICSPGVESIKAAMRPANVPYLYYVAKPDGSHVFSRTFAEHSAAIARIRQGGGR